MVLEWTDDEIAETIDSYMDRYRSEIDPDRLVLVSHDPPLLTKLDQSQHGIPLGSLAIRMLAGQWKPRALLCGHIHESGGVDLFGERTLAVNAGAITTPLVTYRTIEAPTLTNVTVRYTEAFFIVNLEKSDEECYAVYCRYDSNQRQEIDISQTYLIRDGQLFIKTGGGASLWGSTGNSIHEKPTKRKRF